MVIPCRHLLEIIISLLKHQRNQLFVCFRKLSWKSLDYQTGVDLLLTALFIKKRVYFSHIYKVNKSKIGNQRKNDLDRKCEFNKMMS